MSLPTGTRLGRYEVRSPLGKGGMGEVYLAHDPELDRPVALKLLPPEVAADAERMRRFAQEAKAASALNHPNILTIYEVGGVESARFIAAEYVDGVTLRERLLSGPLPLAEALDIALQAASALASAHAAGIVHRDVKPENLMIRRDGWVKVLDFGLAKLAPPPGAELGDAPTQTGLATEAGVVLGTARYMSPEQACGLPVDARTDVWSLGVVLYEMITGRLPFEGRTSGEVLAAVLQQSDPLPLSDFAPGMPMDLDRFVSRALAGKREERYHSMQDLALDLKSLKHRLDVEREARRSGSAVPSAGSPLASAAAVPAPASGMSRDRRRLAIAAVALGVLAAAVLAGARFLRPAGGGNAIIESLAVLPLAAPAADADTELLADGITESLINSLSQVPDLKVIARSSSFRYKGREVDPRAAGRELGVEAVVTGRLARVGDRLAVGVELMQVGDQRQLWGEQYERPLRDLLVVQREISGEVVEQLRRRLTPEARLGLARSYTENVEAYRLYLQGRYYWFKYPRPEYEKSREYLQQAIDLDPNYALAWAGLADYYGFAAAVGRFRPDEAWPKAEAATRKALALDESLAEAHLGAGAQKLFIYRDWQGAESEMLRAIELNPSFAEVHRLHGTLLARLGRWEEAHAAHRRLLELEPLSGAYRQSLAHTLYLERRYEEAIAECRHALELDPGNPSVHRLMGDALELSGRRAEAVAAWRQALLLSGDEDRAALLARTFAAAGFEAAVTDMARAELAELEARSARGEFVSVGHFARLHLRLGNRERALEWIAEAEGEHTRWALEIAADPIYDPLRDHPRFVEFVRRLGLPSASPARPAGPTPAAS